MEEIKYYKVKIKKTGLNWLTMMHFNKNGEFWYSLEKRAMIFSSELFLEKNRLTDFLSDKSYEKVLVENNGKIDFKFIVNEL